MIMMKANLKACNMIDCNFNLNGDLNKDTVTVAVSRNECLFYAKPMFYTISHLCYVFGVFCY